MTIGGLWAYIEKNAIICMHLTPQSAFRGYRIAIDTYSFCFRLMMNARAKIVNHWNFASGKVDQNAIDVVFYRLFMSELVQLLVIGITPIFVFEYGKHPLKTNENKRRELERIWTEERLEDLYNELRQDIFSRKNDKLVEELKSLEKNLKSFPPEVKENLFELLFSLGIPCIQCKVGVEAERVASILCMCDVAMAVYSRDGDCLAHGAPIQIKEIGPTIYDNGPHDSFVVVDREALLETLALTSEEFTDLCICAGCDYNKNMKGVGFAGSLKYIRKYGNVSQFPSSINRECLRYEECLPEFGMAAVTNLISEECIDYYSITDWTSFECLSVKIPESVGMTLDKLGLVKYEQSYLEKVELLPEPQNYRHKQVSTFEVDGKIYTSVYISFPEEGEAYTKPVRARR